MSTDGGRSRPHSRAASDSAAETVIEGQVWKKTAISDYVISRYTRVYSGQFCTYRHKDDPADFKSWRLDADCQVLPATADSMPIRKRHVRPAHLKHLTALAGVSSKGEAIELYTFRVETPNAKTSHFTFGFESFEDAKKWHSAVSGVVAALRAKAHAPNLHVALAEPSFSPLQADQMATPSGAYISLPGGMSPMPQTDRLYLETTTPGTRGSPWDAAVAANSAGAAGGGLASASSAAADQLIEGLLNCTLGTRLARRWIPYKHSNGVAIYQKELPDGEARHGTGEYMVSVVIQGSPLEVLQVMLDPASTTSILGPASEVEVLESSRGRQVLRIRIEAAGPVGQVFRPREAVVQRLFNEQDKGVYTISFNSIDTYDAKNQPWKEGVIEEAEGLAASTRRDKPVRFRVSGTYTISRLENAANERDSRQTLLICSMQIQDMGGWLHYRHVLFPWLDWWYGAYEAFLERMLMSVILVKDAVEQHHFEVAPDSLRRGCGRLGSAPTDVAQAAVAPMQSRPSSDHAVSFSYSLPGSCTLPKALTRLASNRQSIGPAFRMPSLPAERDASSAGAVLSLPAAAFTVGVPSAAGGQQLPQSPRHPKSMGGGPGLGLGLGVTEAVAEFHLDEKYYEELHTPGHDAPFKVRGPRYLQDGKKVDAGVPVFELQGVELVETKGAVTHISRYLEVVRHSSKAFLFVYNMIVPGTPHLSVVMVWGTDQHPDSLGTPPEDPDEGDWEPFDYVLWRFLNGTDQDRRSMFKMIPHIAEGSWLIKQSVGSTPCLIGTKLGTEFVITDKYVEVSTDVGSSAAAAYITGLVRGATKALVIDIGLVLEGQHPYELSEELLGCCRVKRLDLSVAIKLDDSRELDIRN